MKEMTVLSLASYGAQTQRAVKTFTRTRIRMFGISSSCSPGDFVLNNHAGHGTGALGGCRGTRDHQPSLLASIDVVTAHRAVRLRTFCFASPAYVCGLSASAIYGRRSDSSDCDFPSTSKRLHVHVPPLDEQAAIVRFLDWANGRLERAIRAKRKVIALLNEQKQAIIHRAVTRGLDPSVPLKPSGIPWLGDIPQHWEVRRLRYVYRELMNASVRCAKNLLSVSSHYWRDTSQPERRHITHVQSGSQRWLQRVA